ncbi:MAG: hypothetical protein V3U20_10275 [Thermoplasmata archaeon]
MSILRFATNYKGENQIKLDNDKKQNYITCLNPSPTHGRISMETSEIGEIKKLIDNRTKVILDGIEMLHEDMATLKRTINWSYYLSVVLIALVIFVIVAGPR